MNFIERIFHISPDGGGGSTELFVLLVITATLLALGRVACALFAEPSHTIGFRQEPNTGQLIATGYDTH